MFAGLTEAEILEGVTGAEVVKVVRMGKAKEGEGWDPPVLLYFKGEVRPERVSLLRSVYKVFPYRRPVMRCFRCSQGQAEVC